MLTGHYETPLVLISILVAIAASYAALSLAGRVSESRGRAVVAWVFGGAIAMGSGIWAMHFVGMLAFRLPIPIAFDLTLTLASLLLPIAASCLALWQVSRAELGPTRLAVSAVLMGIGINAMHYTGMAAMRMEPGIVYDPWLFALSVAIAIAASGLALWIAFRLRHNVPHVWLPRVGAAVVMGAAIVGMHYTGMAAASFPLDSICMAARGGVNHDGLATLVVIATFGVLGFAMLASLFDARLEANARVLEISQATAAEREDLLMRERAARDEAERLSALKDEFLATLSHELRTPLNAILGWASMLQRGGKDDETVKRGLETIERNARAQGQLIDDLLDMSRIISGNLRLDVQLIEPDKVVEAALGTVHPAAVAKRIDLRVDVARGLGTVLGDPNRLQQVMWNLLSNAVKFTPNGGMVQVMLGRDGQDVVIRVADSGIGIEPDFLPYVFDRFRQQDASITRKHGGLGLGLSIARQLIELHGGTIAVSSPGTHAGTTFTVRLPLAEAEVAPPPQPAAAPRAQVQGDLAGVKVLLVDDATDTLDVLQQILQHSGATIMAASSAGKALALLEIERPDVIVSDIGMPDVDGFELIRRIRRRSAGAGGAIPAIALTAFTRQDDRNRAMQAGFNDYLAKPVEPGSLVAHIAQVVGLSVDQ
ncbi:Sensor protein TorS [Massilia sp. Bi118]|uniref:MHYT domain-containing protein n=1 Tax=Massilia sp. Bi118 TaxID=2822346 RepID=UPI001DEDD007|nr:MHYT domain-containing protein [Massilia sp. Bi118]CAH0165082.1 Sensor protein TorS [Massilia sp. Bi118]